MRRLFRLAAAIAMACAASATTPLSHPAHAADGPAQWTRTWGTAMAAASADETGITGRQTLRMVVHTGVGGSAARIQHDLARNPRGSAPGGIASRTMRRGAAQYLAGWLPRLRVAKAQARPWPVDPVSCNT